MSNSYIEEQNTDKALEYLALGREMFEDKHAVMVITDRLATKLVGQTQFLQWNTFSPCLPNRKTYQTTGTK